MEKGTPTRAESSNESDNRFPINSIPVANKLGKFDKMKPTYKLQPLNGVHIADDSIVELSHSVNLLLFIHLQKSHFGELFLCNRTWVMFA